jgi:3-methylfumaryl-CoA hydratase
MADAVNVQDWIGREETHDDYVARGPIKRLSALLDRPDESTAKHIPPLGHWLNFLPGAPQAQLGPDGHPNRGGLIPPLPLPMRMAAGSRLTFHEPIAFGSDVKRVSKIMSIVEKQGRTGALAFLTYRYQVFAGSTLCITEEFDVVFREKSGNAGPMPPGERREGKVSRTITPTTPLLFRYSALTFNAHKIHYDREYARTQEGYPGLVVHGPLLATLLMDLFRRHRPNDRVKTFEYRAQRPVFDLSPFTVNLEDTPGGADVWACDGDGDVAMAGKIGSSAQ